MNVDIGTLLVLAVVLLVIFAFYLMFRRTLLGFKEGMEKGRK